MKGKKALIAEWNNDKNLENTEDHDTELTKILNGQKFEVKREDGNVKKAFAHADKVIERTYSSPFLPHNCMEPMNFYANVTPENAFGRSHSNPCMGSNTSFKSVGKNSRRNSSEKTRMGGRFGRRLYGDFVLEAAEISDQIKKPKVIFSREDDMTAGTYRPAINTE